MEVELGMFYFHVQMGEKNIYNGKKHAHTRKKKNNVDM